MAHRICLVASATQCPLAPTATASARLQIEETGHSTSKLELLQTIKL